ncbi:MAG: hypothetical protein IJT44_08220 [Clostridia bacterium]|nr:hypothetical protein [Clostridia bacterium]
MRKRWPKLCIAVLLMAAICFSVFAEGNLLPAQEEDIAGPEQADAVSTAVLQDDPATAEEDIASPETNSTAPAKQYARGELVSTYVFTTYGWGHGVGFSQYGALVYGDSTGRFRWNYVQILMHYYPKTHMVFDENMPDTVAYCGVSYPLREYLARATMAEIGGYLSSKHREGTKAQTVAIYTYAKRNGFSVRAGGVAFSQSTPSELVYSCVDEVMGEYVAWSNGNPSSGLFSANYPTWTAAASTTWAGSNYPGLEGGVYSPETVSVQTVRMSASGIIDIANTYNSGKADDRKIHLTGDPSTWVEIIEHDGAYSDNIGYVKKIRIGDQTMTGDEFRTLLFRVPSVHDLRCHCFSVHYELIPAGDGAETATSVATESFPTPLVP